MPDSLPSSAPPAPLPDSNNGTGLAETAQATQLPKADPPALKAPVPVKAAPAPKLPIRFPSKKTDGPSLSLPRRRSTLSSPGKAQALADASDEARRSIERIVSATKAPWGGAISFSTEQASAMEKALRDLESKVEERERLVVELETRLADRERDLAEAEALLAARERVLEAARHATESHGTHQSSAPVSNAERAALEALKSELDRQEKSLLEQKNTIADREHFLDENENKLFEKMQAQQELETQLEQKAEELAAKEIRLQGLAAAAAAKPAPGPKVWDEFKE